MDLTLKRTDFTQYGIFGELLDEDGKAFLVTLEHAYLLEDRLSSSWEPKLPIGSYRCVKGLHELANGLAPFVTFEITSVPNHSGILFHMGNYNKDSNGCVLVGERRSNMMITRSVLSFGRFMAMQDGVDSFTLSVI